MRNDINKSNGHRITRKDLVYLIIILLIVNVAVLVFSLAGNKVMQDRFTFAGTIVGIILSVIAILYTLYNGLVSAEQSTHISQSVDKLKSLSENIDKLNQLEHIYLKLSEVESDFRTTMQDVKVGQGELSQHVYQVSATMSSHLQTFESLFYKSEMNNLGKTDSNNVTNVEKNKTSNIKNKTLDQVDNYNLVKFFPKFIVRLLYVYFKSHEIGVTTDLFKVIQIFHSNNFVLFKLNDLSTTEAETDPNLTAFVVYLLLLNELNWFVLSGDLSSGKIKKRRYNFKKAVIHNTNQEEAKLLLDIIHKLKAN